MEKRFPLKDETAEAAAGKVDALRLFVAAIIATHPDPETLRRTWLELTQEQRNRKPPASSPADWTQRTIQEIDRHFQATR